MKTANIGRIAAEIPQGKKGKFNLSHDNNTTYDWGSVQPLLCKMMLPDSTLNIELEQLKRLAPMVVPTFGRIKTKNIAHFIPMDQIWPNWQAMLTKTKVTRPSQDENGQATSNTYIPKYVPYINNNILAAYTLIGARINIYFSNGAVGQTGENSWTCARNLSSDWSNPTWHQGTKPGRGYLSNILGIASTDAPTMDDIPELNYHGFTMDIRRLILKNNRVLITNTNTKMGIVPSISTMVPTPLQNANGNGYTHSANNEKNTYNLTVGDNHISFREADYIWEYDGYNHAGITEEERTTKTDSPVYGVSYNYWDSCKIRIVFKLSSFGKRLKKVLIGLGYNINLSDDTEVSLLPLIAEYKAWWDTYAPERYKNFYETPAWKIIQICMQTANAANVTPYLNSDNAPATPVFKQFIADLGTCFATEKIDAISAATDNFYGQSNTTDDAQGRSEITKTIIQTLKALNPLENVDESGVQVSVGAAGNKNTEFWNTDLHGTTKAIQAAIEINTSVENNRGISTLTQFQIDALKKAYIGINKASVAGMKVEEILRALGFGDYVEECKGRFINGSDDLIKISDVIATAATEEAKLGQYGGRGLGTSNMQVSYNAKNHGYLIILSCVVPESGYINAPAHENTAISFEKMYNPDYDGISYEAIQKKCLVGSPLINDDTGNQTFGFLPTYTQWKFMSNKANGDFSNNSMKETMRPYTLDKYIPVSDVGVYSTEPTNNHPESTTEICTPKFQYRDTPNAGEDWRFVNKFPWNGDYNRIFAASDDGIEWSVFSPNNNAFLFLAYEYDNIMIHNVFEITYWAHMKEIEESYNTYDEEHGAPKTTIARS